MNYQKRIEALLAKANHENTPREEAEAAAAKAAELMTRYGIEEGQLRKDRGEAAEDEITSDYYDLGDDAHGKALIEAINPIAQAMGAETVVVNGELTLVGTTSMLDNIATLIASLEMQMVTASNKATEEYGNKLKRNSPGMLASTVRSYCDRYLRDYVRGFGQGVAEKIRARRDEIRKESKGNEIALRTEHDRVWAEYDRMFPHRGRTRGLGYSNEDAVFRGRAAGRSADVGDSRVTNHNSQRELGR